jgi:hypothetical protein
VSTGARGYPFISTRYSSRNLPRREEGEVRITLKADFVVGSHSNQLSAFKRTIKQDYICLVVVWLNRPWLGHETRDFYNFYNIPEILIGLRSSSATQTKPYHSSFSFEAG